MTGTRTARAWAATLAGLALLSACGTSDGATVSPPPDTAPATTTAPFRTVPEPEAGGLQVHVPAPEAAGDADAVLLFGDSLAVLVADDLAGVTTAGLHVDGIDCRRLDLGFRGPCGGVPDGVAVPAGVDDLRRGADRLAAAGVTLDAAVVVLGNNGALSAANLDAAMDALAEVPRVWWVTTGVEARGWRAPNNRLLEELADRHPRARVVDWASASAGNDWLVDHVHPDGTGQAALADLVATHLRCDCTP